MNIPYRVVLADPPWQYSDEMRDMVSTGDGAASQYECMTLAEIARFLHAQSRPIANDAHLWLWFTNAFAEEAHQVARAWGFTPKTFATWVKGRIESNGRLCSHIGQGHYLRNSTEHVLFCTRGRAPALAKYLPTAFIFPGRWPGRLHSEKPPVHKWAELMNHGPYLELFARRRREGWTCDGNEVGYRSDV